MRKLKHQLPSISLFFPAYNEAGNIEEAVEQALTVLPQIAPIFEIIIVNDGSNDMTLPIARRLARKYFRVRVVSQENKGYGGAIKLGFSTARYEWIFYSDADLQFDLHELKKFIKYTNKYNLVVGFRKKRAEGWKRQILASGLKLWNKVVLDFPTYIKDIDCAYKLIHRNVLSTISPLFSNGAMISTELLLKAANADFPIKQFGVSHYERRIGKPTGNNILVISKAIWDTFVLKKQLLKKHSVVQFTLAQKKYFQRLPLRLSA